LRELTSIFDPVILSLAVALGIGLLIGTERERRVNGGGKVGQRGVAKPGQFAAWV
jgi:hypothetical protein